MKISAAVTDSVSEPFTLDELRLDSPRPGEVIVRLSGTGICHTDLLFRDRTFPMPLPAVLGHEGAGVIEDIGDGVIDLAPGDHVVLTYNSCGHCPSCWRGAPAQCREFARCNFAGTRLDGSTPFTRAGDPVYGCFFGQSSFATHAVATVRNTVPVRKDVPLHLLGPLGCSVQTGAGAVLNSLRCETGSSITVFGAGSVGCAAILAAVVAGCACVIAVSRSPKRRKLAAQLGATHTVEYDENALDAIRSITNGGTDYSVDTTAVPAVLRRALDCLAPGGTCAHLGIAAPGTEVHLNMSALLLGRQVRGVVEGDSVPRLFIPMLVELYCQGRFPFDRMITTHSMSDINAVITELPDLVTPKAVVIP
jgi:aryl-alcohol dehydrogenase